MKKSVAFAVVVLVALLMFHFSASAAQAPAGRSPAPPADSSATLTKAMADLDASAAQLNEFLNDQGQHGAASNGAQTVELQKVMATLKATTAQIDKFLKDQPRSAAAPAGLQSPEVQKAMASLDASAAELNKFVTDQPQNGAAPVSDPSAEALRKANAELDASVAKVNQFLSEQEQASTAAPDTGLQLSSRFGSRPPRLCPNMTSPPSATQAAALVQCTMDYETPQQAKLHQNIAVQLDSPRSPTNADRWPRIDSRFSVLDFKANATVYVCGPVLEAVMHNTGSNCDRYQFQNAPGVCWKTIDGNYRCQINAGLPTNPTRSQPPPTTY